MTTGWDHSAKAWITSVTDGGDHDRRWVLDAPMLARLRRSKAADMVDIGCSEGRFCRLAQAEGLTTTGIDPTPDLLDHASNLAPDGTYLRASAEALPLPDESCDLAVFYLTLIDIPDARRALAEDTRILRTAAHLLIANLSSFMTAANHDGFSRRPDHSADIHFRNYLKEQVYETAWRGIRLQNWHRPTAFYMRALLENGLTLTHFDEPAST